jgi:hypothetical protein
VRYCFTVLKDLLIEFNFSFLNICVAIKIRLEENHLVRYN